MNENKNEFNDIKHRMEYEYRKVGSIFNHALQSNVTFNSNGWHHLRYDNNRSERSRPVQLNKFRYFSAAVKVIGRATTIQEYRRATENINGREVIVEWFAFWSIISFLEQVRIKVIIKRRGGLGGIFYFWSVMSFWSLRHKQRFVGSQDLEQE